MRSSPRQNQLIPILDPGTADSTNFPYRFLLCDKDLLLHPASSVGQPKPSAIENIRAKQILAQYQRISALGGSKVDAHYPPPVSRPLPRATYFHLTYLCKCLLFEGWRAQEVAE